MFWNNFYVVWSCQIQAKWNPSIEPRSIYFPIHIKKVNVDFAQSAHEPVM
jgi:hypothetical protein